MQSAFVSERAIHDNILVAHEIMNKFNHMKGKQAYVALKLDIEKAYDKLKCDFSFSCLNDKDSHDQWISSIRESINTISYSVTINDEVCGFIRPSRGICQGDPLSPYLFILFMDVLA